MKWRARETTAAIDRVVRSYYASPSAIAEAVPNCIQRTEESEHTREQAMSKEKTYSETEIAAKIQELRLAGWYLEDGWLRRKYNTDGWPQTLMAVNAIGYLCEAAYHHADLAVTWENLGQAANALGGRHHR
jgi:pterin-4a-carbinolamine dehydratase